MLALFLGYQHDNLLTHSNQMDRPLRIMFPGDMVNPNKSNFIINLLLISVINVMTYYTLIA